MADINHMELLQAFRKGDETAFETVFKQYYKSLRLQAYLILNNEQDAEDQVQQLFLDIWNRQLYRNVQESLKAYLHMAIRNRCINCLTKASHRNKALEQYADSLQVTVEEEYNEPALEGYFQSALNELPRQRSKAFHLVYMEDRKYNEAAREMGISINSLKSHLKLAVKFLKMQLQR
jgi:RNA polymerase sigma factor (sigma-70 family)